ncbi:AI-2E family transporter [uncultured Sunxiuqinia sp.]|uniref:AI-2E family transporter n=1 Tax=uncultured Sunxiuqinia sp. TaxID=1573825 RepID=UPI00261BA0F0|nr:AI-2E family transporter [uncultured Sunxiuqinia sp.]
MNLKDIRTTNKLLLAIAIPLFFYLLKILAFIFIPLIASMFIALLFLPLMRWLNKKHVPNPISILLVILIIIGGLKASGELIQLSSNEIMTTDSQFLEKAETKLTALIVSIEQFFGFQRTQGESILSHYFKNAGNLENFGSTVDFISNTLTMTLMTLFFTVLLLSGSINFQKVLNDTIFKQQYSSVKIFMKIEKDIIKFVVVKFLISLFTGVGFSLACIFFDVSYPIFWGLLAFLINFVQMIGSVISVVLLSVFAFIELDPTSTLLFFILSITLVQVLMGGVLEPVFMGKTFSINVITILVMLMLWGFIWGIPGLIMSIPITVFLRIILEQFPKTRLIADLISGPEQNLKFLLKKKK